MDESEEKKEGITRRSFAVGVVGTCALLGMGGLKYVGSAAICRPPGGQDEDRIISLCLHCEKCREVCPKTAIGVAHIEDGILNMRTPKMNFNLGWCDYCAESHDGVPQCVASCPTQALLLPEGATAETVIIGKAEINHDWCLGWLLMDCRYCVDVCPYDAIELDENKRPVVIEDKCNGCGACENVCVSLKNGSINSEATDRAIVVKPVENA